jgi:hypothetical protein
MSTVMKGTFSIGMGDVVDKKHALTLSPGGYGVAMANMHHYAYTTDGATIQVHMQGPFAITYVNPADDPSRHLASRLNWLSCASRCPGTIVRGDPVALAWFTRARVLFHRGRARVAEECATRHQRTGITHWRRAFA